MCNVLILIDSAYETGMGHLWGYYFLLKNGKKNRDNEIYINDVDKQEIINLTNYISENSCVYDNSYEKIIFSH